MNMPSLSRVLLVLLTLLCLAPAQAQMVTVKAEYRVVETQAEKQRVGVALLAALIVGAAPMLVNWFYGLGR